VTKQIDERVRKENSQGALLLFFMRNPLLSRLREGA
jgi:hypothetical protein